MDYTLSVSVISALWLGILTSISPCPLASNIAAVSYIVRETNSTLLVLITGLMYTLGRVVTYSILGVMISMSILNIPMASQILQNIMPKLLGPVLILAGLFLLEVLPLPIPSFASSGKAADRFKRAGMFGALPMGVLFALAFCPVSAALFFGSLIPLCLTSSSAVMLPLVYGIGTGLPVLLFAVVTSLGVKNISKLFNRVTKTELWARKISALILIFAGVYYISTHIFYLNFF